MSVRQVASEWEAVKKLFRDIAIALVLLFILFVTITHPGNPPKPAQHVATCPVKECAAPTHPRAPIHRDGR